MPSVSALQWQIRAGGGSGNPLPLNTSITPQVIPTMKLKLISVFFWKPKNHFLAIYLSNMELQKELHISYLILLKASKIKKISELFIFQF